jgi:NTP pyrophosphatase (non-canonical NTP hydrolase)
MNPHPLQSACHQLNLDKGFWAEPINLGEKIALIHSELSELLETLRENPDAPCEKWYTDSESKRGPLPMSVEEEECADVLLRLMDYAQYRGIDLIRCAELKHECNKSRPTRHGKAF